MRQLFDFQEKCVGMMVDFERNYTLDSSFGTPKVLSNVGILSNDVGSGKTSIVLGHIKRKGSI